MTQQGEPSEGIDFYVTSVYGHDTREPYVSVKLRDVAAQVSPAKAREMAFMLLTAAESSVQDAFMFEFCKAETGADDRGAAVMLGLFRDWRERRKVDEEQEA